MPDHRQETAVSSRARHRRPGLDGVRPQYPHSRQPAVDTLPRPSGRYGLCVDPARGSGHRTCGRRVVRSESGLFRSGEYREAGCRGRLQRRGFDLRRAGRRGAQIRAQDSVHRETQPQRTALLPQFLRSGDVRHRARRLEHGRRRRRRHDLFRLGGEPPPVGRDRRGVRLCPRAGHGDDPVVLPAQRELQEGRRRLPRFGRPHGAGESLGRDHQGRHREAEASGEQRRFPRHRFRQDPRRGLHEADHRPPHRPLPLSGGQRLYGPRGAD